MKTMGLTQKLLDKHENIQTNIESELTWMGLTVTDTQLYLKRLKVDSKWIYLKIRGGNKFLGCEDDPGLASHS